jgi:hypothetical protein
MQCSKGIFVGDNSLMLLQICMGLVKIEPGVCSESCVTSCDDSEAVDIKVEEYTNGRDKKNPLPITFPSIKAEQEVSLYVSII